MKALQTCMLAALAALSMQQVEAATPTEGGSAAALAADPVTRVSGVVTDEAGEPLIGARVAERGKEKNAVVTDANGRFSIQLTSRSPQLTVSYIGFKTVTVPVRGGQVTVRLQEDAKTMEDVVVVAFGKQTRESFTGSAGVVNSEKITERQTENALAAINGQVAGVQMIEGNGPGSEPTIRIRGIGSINASNSPLIILDGVPYNGYYGDINPADIESVTVQKDAASNALYGARGANGVIFITTKSAKRGKATISLDARWGANMDAKVDYDKVTDPGQYYEMHYGALYNYYRNSQGMDAYAAWKTANQTLSGTTDEGGIGYVCMDVPAGQMLIGQGGQLNPNATLGRVVTGRDGGEYLLIPDDWKKEGLRNGLRQEYNVNINGGTEQFDVMASLGYLKNEGVAMNNYYDRYSARLKMNYQAREWLRMGVNSSYTHNETDGINTTFSVAHDIAPIYPVYIRDAQGNILYDSHGKRYDYGDGLITGIGRALYDSQNCIQEDLETKYVNSSNAFGLNGYLDIDFLKDFKFTVNADVSDTENRWVSTTYPYYGFYAQTGGGSSVYHYRTFGFNTQQLLNWNRSFGAHNVSALAGHEYYRNTQTTLYGSKTVFYDYDTNIELDGNLTNYGSGSSKSIYNVEGWFLRAMYDYDSRYFLSASYRRDGSSTFAPNYRWGNFWSLGGAWIVTKESFMDGTKGWLDMLKLKASYGSQGNDGIGSYRYTDVYNYSSAGGRPAYTFSSLGTEDITWETNGNFNTGIEFELFKRRLTGSVEYYRRKTTDMLLWVHLPLSYGSSGYYDNVGDMLNQGVELTLKGDVIRTKYVQWSVNMNLSHNHNEVTYLNEDNKGGEMEGHRGYNSGTKFVGEGLPLYTWRVKKYAGVNEADGRSMWYYTDKSTGELKTTTTWDQGDYYLCGDANARVYGGFGTDLKAYGFDLTCNFIYRLGGLVNDGGYSALMCNPYSGWTGYAYHKDLLNAWTPENTGSDIPRWQYGDMNTSAMSDRWLTSGNYLTLKNISVGYSFPKHVLDKLQLTKLRVYCSADNVAYWTARKGMDPRNSLSGSASGTGYSPMRVISGGVSVAF